MSKVDNNKTKSTNAIGYKGSVSVKLVKNGKVLKTKTAHNMGCDALFEFLVNALGSRYSGQESPKYLRCFYNDGTPTEANLGTELTISPSQYINVRTKNEGGTRKVSFEFMISSSGVNKTLVDANKINVLAMYSTRNAGQSGSPSAFLKLDNESAISINELDVGINIIIAWDMSFVNVVV